MEKYLELLETLPLFDGINRNDIPVILNRLKSTASSYEKGEYIRLEGDAADFIGIVLEGEIHVLQDDYYGNRNINFSFHAGDMFAEAFACAEAAELPVDILATSRAYILFLDRSMLFGECNKTCAFHSILIRNLLKIVAGKNMLLNQKLSYSSHKTTGEKIMAYLSDQAKLHHSSEFIIPFNRQELADYLGVERSAMSAEISRLQKQGRLITRRSYFKLLSPTLSP
ncbi:Crp/Fnr family transcriptional regulator [Faecalicatena contorta]|uniref:Crp/Fnr family transcriptional regulator n=1 Tax=Faecalicatena contorta TaxID=39482 RepID=UPI001F23A567|nr:Crp/Fnr family transcriptional regulator [Faecalicatena contorta]MCF2682651.1 Crp/Fnr family transcriptional regulator [Faecalicatena contorta]